MGKTYVLKIFETYLKSVTNMGWVWYLKMGEWPLFVAVLTEKIMIRIGIVWQVFFWRILTNNKDNLIHKK
jgi:hypothetical protein